MNDLDTGHRAGEDECELVGDVSTRKGESKRNSKKKRFDKRKDQKHDKDGLTEVLFSVQLCKLMEKYQLMTGICAHPCSITTISEASVQLLQTNTGIYCFSYPKLSLQAVLPKSQGPVLVPSCALSSNLHKRAFLAVFNSTRRYNCSVLAVICPSTRKHLRRLFTIEQLYSPQTVSFSTGRLVSYLTRSLDVVTVPLDKMVPSVRKLKNSLKNYLDQTLSTDALLSVDFEGLLVEWIGHQELIILWGKWNSSPFICVYFKKHMAVRLAVFDLLSAFTSSVTKVSLLPANFVKDGSSTTSERDIYLTIYGNDKLSIHRLRQTTDNRFADNEAPCCTLDHMASASLV